MLLSASRTILPISASWLAQLPPAWQHVQVQPSGRLRCAAGPAVQPLPASHRQRAVWQAMAEVDRRCLLEGHPEYLALVRPESMRQRTATGFCQDLALYARQPWSFQPKDLPSSTTRNIHLWHGTNDMQVQPLPRCPAGYAHPAVCLVPVGPSGPPQTCLAAWHAQRTSSTCTGLAGTGCAAAVLGQPSCCPLWQLILYLPTAMGPWSCCWCAGAGGAVPGVQAHDAGREPGHRGGRRPLCVLHRRPRLPAARSVGHDRAGEAVMQQRNAMRSAGRS